MCYKHSPNFFSYAYICTRFVKGYFSVMQLNISNGPTRVTSKTWSNGMEKRKSDTAPSSGFGSDTYDHYHPRTV